MKFGVIGAGFIGRALARIAIANGHEVMIANSRGPQTLGSAAIALHCRAGTVAEAARFGDVIVMAIPMRAVFDLDPAPFDGRIVMDANNYYPQRDQSIAELDRHEATTSGLLARQLPGARVVKAFNAILQDDIEKDARPAGAAGRRALPIAGDDAEAKRIVAQIVDQFGFDPADAGDLADSWRFERAMPCYCVPLQTGALKEALAAAQRGVEVPYGAWRERREAAHAALLAATGAGTQATPQSAASAKSAPAAAGKRQAIGFAGRGVWDIVDTQFHLGPQQGAEASLAAMDALGIRAALVDELWGFDERHLPQPCAPLEGYRYRSLSPLGLAATLAHPARFSFIQRLEADDPLLLSRIPLLAQTPGCRALRINLLKDKDRQQLVSGGWDAALALAQQHRLPVAVLTEDAGRLLAPVASRFEALSLVVDHCGWVQTPQQWQEVLQLAHRPNVYLKWSHARRAFRRHADPVQAEHQALVDAVRAFGANRVSWAGDVSYEESNASWSELLSFVRDHTGLSEEDRAWVLGRTARQLYRWEA